MVQGVGIDLQDVNRTVRLIERYGEHVVDYLFTKKEWDTAWLSLSPLITLTIMFSFKESVSKALGTGISDVHWTDIEVLPDLCCSSISLHGNALQVADCIGITHINSSWKKTGQLILTQVIVQSTYCEKGCEPSAGHISKTARIV